MPELPEAETIARHLHERLRGHTLGRVLLTRRDIVHGDPRPIGRLLRGRHVSGVHRRAKRVILRLDPPMELVFHLGMSGRLTISDRHAAPEAHTHLRIAIADTEEELRFRDPRRFGGVWLQTGHETSVGRRLGELGVEPLDVSLATFRRVLHRSRQIKALLLDQRVVAGLGNIYCDEALHVAGVHPLTPASVLDHKSSARLLRAIKTTLRRAIRFQGTTLMDYRQADGTEGSFRRFHRVYDREGKSCASCGGPIVRIKAAGRSSYLCARCQPFQSNGAVHTA